MIITEATDEHVPGLLRLEECFEHQRWNQTTWDQEVAAPNRHVLVALDDGAVRGAAVLRVVEAVADLDRVVVEPSCRRQGLGRQLVRLGMDWAQDRGAHRLLLEVEERNAAAVALYHQLGFTTVARRDNYYSAGSHALVMELALTPVSGRRERQVQP